jgi:hypothetical protein
MYVQKSSGNIGIGTTGPSVKLDVNGQIRERTISSVGSSDPICYGADGVLGSCSSSIRYKENVVNIANGLSDVMKMRPITYTWKTNGNADLGFVAEEINQINPLYTFNNSEGQVEGVKYGNLTAILAKAIQEQQGQIDGLKLAFENATSTLDLAHHNSGIVEWVSGALQSLGLALKDGVASLKELVVGKATIDQIQNKQIRTKQMCVMDSAGNDICLTGDQLKDLITRTGSSVTVSQPFAQITQTVEHATSSTVAIESETTENISQQQVITILNQIAAETATTTKAVAQ